MSVSTSLLFSTLMSILRCSSRFSLPSLLNARVSSLSLSNAISSHENPSAGVKRTNRNSAALFSLPSLGATRLFSSHLILMSSPFPTLVSGLGYSSTGCVLLARFTSLLFFSILSFTARHLFSSLLFSSLLSGFCLPFFSLFYSSLPFSSLHDRIFSFWNRTFRWCQCCCSSCFCCFPLQIYNHTLNLLFHSQLHFCIRLVYLQTLEIRHGV